MTSLFPPSKPFSAGHIRTLDGVHELYYEEYGNPTGHPIIFVHGGPGSGCNPLMPRFFDPVFFRVILTDQRGCGRSRPLGCLERNTPARLVEDMEQLREHLHIAKWAVYGGSWGCTLALLYACAHADRLTGLCVGGVFLARPSEVEWLVCGSGAFFPEQQKKFMEAVPAVKPGAMGAMEAYRKVVFGDDRAAAVAAAHAWGAYEDSFSLLVPLPKKQPAPPTTAAASSQSAGFVSVHADDDRELARTKIMLHYLSHNCFLEECFSDFDPVKHTLLEECVDKLQCLASRDVPVCIVQGRYDMVCPPHTAYELHTRALPKAKYVVVPDGGHSYEAPQTERAYLEAAKYLQAGVKL